MLTLEELKLIARALRESELGVLDSEALERHTEAVSLIFAEIRVLLRQEKKNGDLAK